MLVSTSDFVLAGAGCCELEISTRPSFAVKCRIPFVGTAPPAIARAIGSNSIRSTDLVGRWSGDEFVIVLDCDLAAAKSQIERMEKWVFGEYPIQAAGGKGEVKVNIDAAVGMAQWHAGETLQQLIERADSAMYSDKKLAKKAKA